MARSTACGSFTLTIISEESNTSWAEEASDAPAS